MAHDLNAVAAQFAAHGMPEIAGHEIEVGSHVFVRYGPKKRAYYKLFENRSRAGNVYYTGVFGHKGDGPYKIEFDGAAMTPGEIAEMQAKREASAAREKAQRARMAQRAAQSAEAVWAARSEMMPGAQIEYLRRKSLSALWWYCDARGHLIVPMVRDGALVGVQTIAPDGEKRFGKGTSKIGAFCRLRKPPATPRVVLVAEGFATAASVHLALGRERDDVMVIAAFDAGNLLPVVQRAREAMPAALIGICADDDFLTVGNPGKAYAARAAKAVSGVTYCAPQFAARGGEKWTDFNDLLCAQGIGAVRTQVLAFLKFMETGLVANG